MDKYLTYLFPHTALEMEVCEEMNIDFSARLKKLQEAALEHGPFCDAAYNLRPLVAEMRMSQRLLLIDAKKDIYRAIFPLPNNWRDMELYTENCLVDPQDVQFDSYSDGELLALIDKIIHHNRPQTSELFWEKAETAFLRACVFYLCAVCEPSEQNFYNVLKLIRCGWLPENLQCEQTSLDQLFTVLEKTAPEDIGVLNYMIFKSVGNNAEVVLDILTSCEFQLMSYISQSSEN